MEWRCEWCGKPHAEDDPPCDNCGHGSFERAIVRQTDLGDGGDPDTMTVWVCTACGREHPRHSPPCSRCNNARLERQEKRVDESNLTERPGSAEYETVSTETTTVWVCAECDREHTKHSPPCSRCGHPTLNREEKRVGDDEITAPGYRELVTPRYLAVLGVVLALVALFVLGAAGIVDLPGFPDDSVPDVENVPGNATTTGRVSLAEVEDDYLDALDDRRTEAGLEPLERSDHLDEVAQYHNQRWVRAEFGEGTRPSNAELGDLLGSECDEAGLVFFSRTVEGDDATFGEQLADELAEGDSPLLAGIDRTGVDVHSVEGTLYLTQLVCA